MKNKNIVAEENKSDNNVWGEIESVEVMKKKEKTQLLSKSNKKDDNTFGDFCATSVAVGNKQLPKQSSNYTL